MLASPTLDFHLTDTYFVVAHFHYVMLAASCSASSPAIYYWFPKFTGRMLDERLGKVHFWLHVRRLQHDVLRAAHPRAATACPAASPTTPRRTGWADAQPDLDDRRRHPRRLRSLPFLWNVWRSLAHGAAGRRQPVGRPDARVGDDVAAGPGNFDRPLPPIRSERPVWDANHPDALAEALSHDRPVTTSPRPGSPPSSSGSTPGWRS